MGFLARYCSECGKAIPKASKSDLCSFCKVGK
jgi:endogenous inhibitor of DNA gyrase (YacG/DUF329 family)